MQSSAVLADQRLTQQSLQTFAVGPRSPIPHSAVVEAGRQRQRDQRQRDHRQGRGFSLEALTGTGTGKNLAEKSQPRIILEDVVY